jgi:hypothetical protein
LHDENRVLRTQVVQAEENANAMAEQVAANRADLDELASLRKANAELLPLRNEVRQLREQVAVLRTARMADAPLRGTVNTAAEDRASVLESMKALGAAASRGDFGALDKLGEIATGRVSARTNQQEYVLGDVKLAFDVLGAEAGNGNDTAFQALARASRMKKQHLTGLAIQALGEAAEKGNEQALDMLVNPERYQLLLSSTVFALRAPAQNGNPRAIDALARVGLDEKATPLWGAVTEGLQSATIDGNPNAINAMTVIARSAGKPGQRMAFLALEDAAANHPQAAEALRGLRPQ